MPSDDGHTRRALLDIDTQVRVLAECRRIHCYDLLTSLSSRA